MGQVGDRHHQGVVRLGGQVFDAVLDQCHQCGELVRGGAQPGLQGRDDALAEEEGVGDVVSHRRLKLAVA